MLTNEVIRHFGTQTEVAKRLGLTKGAISQWGERVPFARALQIDRLTRGRLKFNPADYPNDWPQGSVPPAA